MLAILVLCLVVVVGAQDYTVSRPIGGTGDRLDDQHHCGQCERVVNSTYVPPCTCQCQAATPILNQYLRLCSDVFYSECEHTVTYRPRDGIDYYAANLFYLPLNERTVNVNYVLDWRRSPIVGEGDFVDCSIDQMGVLTSESGWVPFETRRRPFFLVNTTTATVLRWHGLGENIGSHFLSGKQVKLTMRCPTTHRIAKFCIAFSVVGTDSNQDPAQFSIDRQSLADNDDASSDRLFNLSKTGEIVAVICMLLLVVALVAVLIMWIICWRYHKDKLARRLTRQLFEQRQQQMVSAFIDSIDCQAPNGWPSPHGTRAGMSDYVPHMFHAPYVDTSSSMSPRSLDANGYAQPHMLPHDEHAMAVAYGGMPVKKKLFFSPDFFEPQLMANPPDVANEFLYEVRRMIDVAKARIRAKRHVPQLCDIEEETSSMEEGDKPSTSTASPKGEMSASQSSGGSPRDADSGFASQPSTPSTTSSKVSQWLERLPDEIDVDEGSLAPDRLLKYLRPTVAPRWKSEERGEAKANGTSPFTNKSIPRAVNASIPLRSSLPSANDSNQFSV